MPQATDPSRDLLFGLLALQNGLIDQGALFAAFAAWTRDKGRPLADHLVALGQLDPDDRAAVEVLADRHLKKHGGDVEKSLAVLAVGRSTRESLAQAGGTDVEATLGHVGSAHPSTHNNNDDPDRTGTVSVGSPTSDGQQFRIVRPHAKGGFGSVFVALDSELDREVALKQILDHHADDPTSRYRFLIEAQITGGLEHPGIVPVYGLGAYRDGRPYYAMRFIRGDSLKEAIDDFHKAFKLVTVPAGSHDLGLRKLLRRFMDVCNAIDYAHSRGVIHRDIKPANIIVGKYGETLVVDWGLAKPLGRIEAGTETGERLLMPSSASGSSETLPGSALGTPAYMSPEQAEGQLERLGPRSDGYSLGATLYCLLTGQPPFTGDVVDVIRAAQKGEFRPPRQLDPIIDPALEAICLKAMSHRPEDRYASSRALADDLDRWMADEPVTAWSEPFAHRARRWARRNRTAMAAAAVALVAGVIGLSAVLAVQTQAKAELSRSKAAVQARYDLAVEAIQTFHTGVSEDFLLKQDQFKEVRDRLLKSASDFYGKLGALLGKESDVASRRTLWQANYEVAELTDKVGKPEDGLAAHRQVLAAREALAAETSADLDVRADVGRSQTAVARLLEATGQTKEAEATYRKAETLLVELSLTTAEAAAARAVLANCRSSLGELLYTTGRNDEALTIYRLARADQEAMAAAHGAPAESLLDLANTINRIANLLAATGKSSEGDADYRKTLAIRQKLADDNPGVTDFLNHLAGAHYNLGVLLARTGKPSEAEAEYRMALGIYQKLADDNPGVTDFRSRLATSRYGLGALLAGMGKPSEAEAEYRVTLAIYQKLADDNPVVTDFRSHVAHCYLALGMLLSDTRKSAEAEAEYRKALTIEQKLADDNPAVTNFRSSLADIHNRLGRLLYLTGRSTEAEVEYRAALTIEQKLADDNPTVTDFRSRLAESHNGLGRLLYHTGRSTGAEVEYRAALAIQQKLADDNPTDTEFRIRLAFSHNGLGELLGDAGKSSEAVVEYRKGLALEQKMADENPDIPRFQVGLATSLLGIGWQLAQAGKTAEAIGYYTREEGIRRKLAEASSATPEDRNSLANCQTNAADLFRRSGRLDEALAACERAAAVRELLIEAHPEFPSYRADLGETYLRLGQVRCDMKNLAGAAAAWKRACVHYDGSKSLRGEQTFFRGCCNAGLSGLAGRTGSGASAAEGANQADKAMAVLRQAVAMGYRNPDAYRTESALDPLRDRPDFRLLMMDLVMPTRPFAH